jgi:hypothetical protein
LVEKSVHSVQGTVPSGNFVKVVKMSSKSGIKRVQTLDTLDNPGRESDKHD